MFRCRFGNLMIVAGACFALGGCMPKMTVEQMKEQMPKRPAELEKLNAFVGTWQSEGKAQFAMLEQPLVVTGRSTAQWAGDSWYLVSNVTFNMEHFGESQGMEIWMYDAHSKKYRSSWVDTMGMIGLGEATCDEKSQTWKMQATSYGPWGKSTMYGTVRFPDADTMEWEWAGYMGFMKTTQMSGSAKRVK